MYYMTVLVERHVHVQHHCISRRYAYPAVAGTSKLVLVASILQTCLPTSKALLVLWWLLPSRNSTCILKKLLVCHPCFERRKNRKNHCNASRADNLHDRVLEEKKSS